LNVQPTEHTGNRVFARMELNADLTDTRTNSVLVPFNLTQREGHSSDSEAQNILFLRVEQRIAGEYGDLLSEHISGLLQGK